MSEEKTLGGKPYSETHPEDYQAKMKTLENQIDEYDEKSKHNLTKEDVGLGPLNTTLVDLLFAAMEDVSILKSPPFNPNNLSDKEMMTSLIFDVCHAYLDLRSKIDLISTVCKTAQRDGITAVGQRINELFGYFVLNISIDKLESNDGVGDTTPSEAVKSKPETRDLVKQFLSTNYGINLDIEKHSYLAGADLVSVIMHYPSYREITLRRDGDTMISLTTDGKASKSERLKKIPVMIAEGLKRRQIARLLNVSYSTVTKDIRRPGGY